MKFPVLASVIVFIIILTFFIRRSDKKMEHELDDFFDRERRANSVRRQNLDSLPYIKIPQEILSLTSEEEHMAAALDLLSSLKNLPIVNLTGIRNTDLKLQYGTANITVLSEYDQNYTLLARTLQELAGGLFQENRLQEAALVLEFAVSTRTDISASYKLLADIYLALGTPDKLQSLLEQARTLDSVMKPSIVRYLEEKQKLPQA